MARIIRVRLEDQGRVRRVRTTPAEARRERYRKIEEARRMAARKAQEARRRVRQQDDWRDADRIEQDVARALGMAPRKRGPKMRGMVPKKPDAQKKWEAQQTERARRRVPKSWTRPIAIPPAKWLDDSWRFD